MRQLNFTRVELYSSEAVARDFQGRCTFLARAEAQGMLPLPKEEF